MKKTKLLFALCACLLVMVACHQQTDSTAASDVASTTATDSQENSALVAAKIEFFKTFFARHAVGDWLLENGGYDPEVLKCFTPKMLQLLQDAYDYDKEPGDIRYAVWFFHAGGNDVIDLDNQIKTMRVDWLSGDWFLITLTDTDVPISYALKIIRTENGDFQIDDAKRYTW